MCPLVAFWRFIFQKAQLCITTQEIVLEISVALIQRQKSPSVFQIALLEQRVSLTVLAQGWSAGPFVSTHVGVHEPYPILASLVWYTGGDDGTSNVSGPAQRSPLRSCFQY